MSENQKLVLDAAVSREGRETLTCLEASALSREHGISLKKIGETCNEHGIKIIECQLGCFK
jgi:hypothetical protein